jgi:hypothetical protein
MIQDDRSLVSCELGKADNSFTKFKKKTTTIQTTINVLK